MTIKLYHFSVEDKRSVAEGTTVVTFNTAGQNFSFKAGQYVRITIPGLAAEVARGNTRDFTIASSPNTTDSFTVVFRDSDSPFKQALINAPVGLEVIVQGPLGVFVLPEDQTIPLVFLAGGIGVTPFLSMIRFANDNKLPYKIHLAYANSNQKKAAYLSELSDIASKNKNFTLTERLGPLDIEVIKKKIKFSDQTLWYICGLPQMVITLAGELPRELDLPAENIRTEEYIGYDTGNQSYRARPAVADGATAMVAEDTALDQSVLKALVDTAGQNALVAVTDPQGTILYVNQKFIDVTKYSLEELIGQNHRILKSGYHHPKFYEELWQTISSGKLWRGEIKNRAKNGSFYWVDASISPVFDDNGKIKRYVAIRFLITDKKELEQVKLASLNLLEDLEFEKKQVTEAKAKDEAILSSIGDAVMACDKSGLVMLFNGVAEELTGFSVKEVTGRHYSQALKFVRESDEKTGEDFIAESIKTGQAAKMADYTLLIRKDGRKIPVADSAAPIKNVTGEIVGCVLVFRDMTKEREVDKAKNEFVSLASHQLRTPLSTVNWYAEMLLAGDAGKLNEEQKKYLDEVYRGNQRMVELVNALLNVSRIELGTFVVEPEPTDVVALAQSVMDEQKPQIDEKKIKLSPLFEKNIPTILADPKLLRMVVQNLLSNAVQYTPEGGKIEVSLSLSNVKGQMSNVLIKVSDTGYGIPKNQQDKIFSKLFRADNVREKDTEGTGLGLYIVKSIIEHSGGKVWFESEENKGTTFSVTLPHKYDGPK